MSTGLFDRAHGPAARVRRGALATLALVGAAGCGNLTAGGFGDVTVAVSGDAPDSSPAPMSAGTAGLRAAAVDFGAPPPAGSDDFDPDSLEGHVEAKFMLFLVTEGGNALRLGDEELEVSVDLRGRSEVEAVDRQPIPAGRYSQLQVVFTEIRAEVEGLVLGGVPIPEVRVEVDATLVVSRALDLDVAERESVDLVVDLNSLSWLAAVDPITATVDEAVFASLFDIAIR